MVVGRERPVASIFRRDGADAHGTCKCTSEGECLDLGMRGPAELYAWCTTRAFPPPTRKLLLGFRGRL